MLLFVTGLSSVVEWARDNQQGLGLTDRRQKELYNTKAELFDQFKNLTVAESKLMLLGLSAQSALLRQYGEFLKRMRCQYFEGKEGLSVESMDSAREELLGKRAALFLSLSEAYHSDS
jgi:nitrogenase molybdenum-iron protein alpha/beta subunit